MFVDTSAFVAIFTQEADSDFYANAIRNSDAALTSPLVKLETVMVMAKFFCGSIDESRRVLEQFIATAMIRTVELDDKIGQISIDAFRKFGKGQNNSAKLNIADCMHYAVAKKFGVPILCKRSDFSETDLKFLRSPD